MRRRKFIGQSMKAGLAGTLVLPSIIAYGSRVEATAHTPTGPEKFELEEATIQYLQKQMDEGRLTSRSITQMYLNRIAELERKYALKAVIEVNPDALSIAETLDRERKDGKGRGSLHGIPVLIKDNIDTADKMMTTAGSLALEGHFASSDAFLVQKLREAGAVLLGKTNLSEWANFRSTRSSSGWSSRGGQTKNPYVLDRSPCGSSSGSGTAVAANLCAVAIGTETNGSIACPSSTNGIVGIKPTVGLWSRSGIIPISATQDTAGPMARNVRDAVILLGALTGEDVNDKRTAASKGRVKNDYTAYLDAQGLRGKTIGVEKSLMKGHEAIDKLLSNALNTMKDQGATIVEVELLDKLKDPDGDEFEFLKYEFKDGLNKYLASAKTMVRSLQDVIDFNRRNEERAMPFFKQEILEDAQSKGSTDSEEYKRLHERLITKTRTTIDKLFSDHKLDALCGPTNGPSWCIDLVNGDFFTGYGMYSPAAVADYPSITVPMGMVLNLPIGITFMSGAYTEPTLIQVAYAYEQASRMRVAPQFRESVD